jgi:hypothetical protein
MPSVAGVIAGQGKSVVRRNMLIYYDPFLQQSYPGSGTAVTDLSGSGNNGTLQATPTYNSAAGFFTYNGASSQYISTTTALTNPGPYTISAWFRTSTASGRCIVNFESAQTGTGSTSYDRSLYMGTNGNIYFGNYDGTIDVAVSSTTLNNNVWHYVAGTYGGEGTTMRLYVNGASNATQTSTTYQNYTGYWRIAGYALSGWTNGANGYYTGDIGPVMIYSASLTAEEIAQNFNAMRGRFGV